MTDPNEKCKLCGISGAQYMCQGILCQSCYEKEVITERLEANENWWNAVNGLYKITKSS